MCVVFLCELFQDILWMWMKCSALQQWLTTPLQHLNSNTTTRMTNDTTYNQLKTNLWLEVLAMESAWENERILDYIEWKGIIGCDRTVERSIVRSFECFFLSCQFIFKDYYILDCFRVDCVYGHKWAAFAKKLKCWNTFWKCLIWIRNWNYFS